MRIGTRVTPCRVSQSQRATFGFGQWSADAIRIDFQRSPASQRLSSKLTSLTWDVLDLAFTRGSSKLRFNKPRVRIPYQHALLAPQELMGLPRCTMTALIDWPVGPILIVQPPSFA